MIRESWLYVSVRSLHREFPLYLRIVRLPSGHRFDSLCTPAFLDSILAALGAILAEETTQSETNVHSTRYDSVRLISHMHQHPIYSSVIISSFVHTESSGLGDATSHSGSGELLTTALGVLINLAEGAPHLRATMASQAASSPAVPVATLLLLLCRLVSTTQ